MPWEPFDPVSYYLHVVTGIAAALAGLTALTTRKGTQPHILAGRIFAGCMAVAAITTMVFMVEQPVGIAAFAALLSVYLIGTAILTIRRHRVSARGLDGLFLAGGAALVLFLLRLMWVLRTEFPERLPVLGVFVALVVALLAGDIRRLHGAEASPTAVIRRHLMRMCLAFAVAMTAATVTNQVRLGLSAPVAILGPFLVMSLVGGAFWLRQGRER